ncbi:chemotaxis protein CheW [Planctobacterium marinum]|uniref:chemotaxis protein CheW n=1 Tax=Planctobacterium marinum TaxID=1631968 RepID=UPI001E3B1BE2|nr:chemotaxis protein CheW [Planctobacterium marinum]MCC2607801.1 chemotaxis protein CheW [Planctobacterium marinum]
MTAIEATDVKELEDLDEQDVPKAEWLSFKLAGLDYAVDILRVQEIRVWQASTRIPYSPAYVNGLINLRGAIVPIVDLRLRLGLDYRDYDAETVTLIMDVVLNEGNKTIGIVVDAISEVIQTDTDNAQLSADFDLTIDQAYVSGIADDGEKMVILLNVDTLLDLDI